MRNISITVQNEQSKHESLQTFISVQAVLAFLVPFFDRLLLRVGCCYKAEARWFNSQKFVKRTTGICHGA